MKKKLGLVAFVAMSGLLYSGCKSFLRFSDPTAQAISCVVTGTLMPAIQVIVAMTGIPANVVEALYADACGDAANRGLSQAEAEKFGLERARSRAMTLHRLGATFPHGAQP
jgi:hypothetical protein